MSSSYRESLRSCNASIVSLFVAFIDLIQTVNGGVVSWGRGGRRNLNRCKNPPCYTEPKPPEDLTVPIVVLTCVLAVIVLICTCSCYRRFRKRKTEIEPDIETANFRENK